MVVALLAGLLALTLAFSSGLSALRRPDIPYEALDARYGAPSSRRLELPGGVRLHYRDEGAPDGPALLLIPGFAASAADFDGWAERLGRDHRLIAVDLPGEGLTEAPPGYRASIQGDLALIEALLDRLHLSRVVVAGHSLGGEIAFNFALAHPDRVRALALIDAAGWPRGGAASAAARALFASPPARVVLERLDERSLARRGLRAAFADPERVGPALVNRYADFARAPGHKEILLTQAAGGEAEATPERLERITAPTLVMEGEEDRLIPLKDAARFARFIPKAELVLVPHAGHLPMLEEPDASALDLRRWLQTTP